MDEVFMNRHYISYEFLTTDLFYACYYFDDDLAFVIYKPTFNEDDQDLAAMMLGF